MEEPSGRIARYELDGQIGEGATARVYKAYDPRTDRHVAIKVLAEGWRGDGDYVQRFLSEARAAGALSHANIVSIYDVDHDGPAPYITMELVDGPSLSQVLREHGRLPAGEAVRIVLDLARALEYAHSRGRVHRDIKPSNILLNALDRQPKLTDFGIAMVERPDATQLTQHGQMLGTPRYMSPEQIEGRRVDARSDLFSLGVTFYEMVTGARAFTGDNIVVLGQQIREQQPRPVRELAPDVPAAVVAVIDRLLQKAPEARFQSGGELARALEAARAAPAESRDAGAPGRPTAAGPARTGRSRLPPLLALLVLLIVAGGLAVLYFAAESPLGPEPPVAVVPLDETRVVLGAADIRARPATEGEIVDRLAEGVSVRVTGHTQELNWYRVQLADGSTGFVPAELLGAPPPPKPEPPIVVAAVDGLYAALGDTAVRVLPSDDSETIARLAPDETIRVTGRVRDLPWYRVELADGAEGFVAADTLTPPAPARPPLSPGNAGWLQLASEAAELPCTRIQAERAADGRIVRGATGTTEHLEALRGRAAELDDLAGLQLTVETKTMPFCRVYEMLARATGPAPAAFARLETGRTDNRLERGDLLMVRLQVPGSPSYVFVDYFTNDGQVAHMYPENAIGDLLPAGETYMVGDPADGVRYKIDEPFGRELILVIAAPAPLFDAPRPFLEAAEEYLEALEAALAAMPEGQPALATTIPLETVDAGR